MWSFTIKVKVGLHQSNKNGFNFSLTEFSITTFERNTYTLQINQSGFTELQSNNKA